MRTDLKVTTDASENTSHKGQPYRAFRIAHAGKQGSFIGRYATAIDAAVAVARDVRDRGIDRRTLVVALDKGLKGEALLVALDEVKARKEPKSHAHGGCGGDGDEEPRGVSLAKAEQQPPPPATEAPVANGVPVPSPPRFLPITEVGAAGVRAALARLNLEQYAATFDDLGYDDLPYLLRMSAEARQEVAVEAGLKPGHARKFIELLGDVVSLPVL